MLQDRDALKRKLPYIGLRLGNFPFRSPCCAVPWQTDWDAKFLQDFLSLSRLCTGVRDCRIAGVVKYTGQQKGEERERRNLYRAER